MTPLKQRIEDTLKKYTSNIFTFFNTNVYECVLCMCLLSLLPIIIFFNSFEILFMCSHLLLAVSINALEARQQAAP